MEVTINNEEPVTFGFHQKYWQAPGVYNLYFNVNGNGQFNWSNNDYEFRFSLKNGKSEEIAYGIITETAPADITIPTKADIELGESNAAATFEVTATGVGAAATALDNITWTLTGGDGYVSIPDDSTGATVTITATTATTEGVTITLTATLVVGDKTITKTCTVTVRAHGVKPTKPVSTFDVALAEAPYGEHYFHFTTSNLPTGFSYAYVKVYKNNETTGTQRWAELDASGHLRIYVTDPANAFDGDWKFEFYDGTGAVCATVYFTYPVPSE